jgi:hypothetical protein
MGAGVEEADPMAEPAFKHFRYFCSLVNEKLKQASSVPRSPHPTPGHEEINKINKCELLGTLATDLMTIPASSAPIERVFSVAGYVSCGKRNRISDKSLEREVLIKLTFEFLCFVFLSV